MVTDNGIKVEAPDAYTITATDTIKCMADMSQKAWEHISTGPLFKHFFDTLFQQRPVTLPESIKVLNEDYDEGVVHACGLIILLVESRFNGVPQVFLKLPETHLHPAVCQMLMTVIYDIQKLPGPDSATGDIQVTQ